MKETKCELVRRELEELMLDEEFSNVAAEHLETCAECSEFQRQQTKLRQIVGSLGTVNAPADFDFRLRARLAADSQASSFHFWPVAMKGLVTAAVLVVFGVGAAVVWQRGVQQTPVAEMSPAPVEAIKPAEPAVVSSPRSEALSTEVVNNDPRRNIERPQQTAFRPKRALTTVDFSSERADVITDSRTAMTTATVFPIEASLESLKVSLDDGRGNARTISVPKLSFGSQRVLATGNQFAPKGDW